MLGRVPREETEKSATMVGIITGGNSLMYASQFTVVISTVVIETAAVEILSLSLLYTLRQDFKGGTRLKDMQQVWMCASTKDTRSLARAPSFPSLSVNGIIDWVEMFVEKKCRRMRRTMRFIVRFSSHEDSIAFLFFLKKSWDCQQVDYFSKLQELFKTLCFHIVSLLNFVFCIILHCEFLPIWQANVSRSTFIPSRKQLNMYVADRADLKGWSWTIFGRSYVIRLRFFSPAKHI